MNIIEANKSSFPYWFAHWCAFQMTALNLKAWKFKYLFHDIEKPWLKLFLPYEKVRRIHRKIASHHMTKLSDNSNKKIDWEAMIIDWECSRFTKMDAQLNAVSTYNMYLNSNLYDKKLIKENIPPILKKFNLI